KGDSMPAIAKMFGVSVNTIYWANDLKKGDKLKEGDTLVILPFDGLTHTVKAKETLAGIAKLYKADIDDIMAFNGMNKGDKLVVGDEIIIPEGQKTEESDKPVKKSTTTVVKNTTPSKNLKSVDGYFIYPLPTGPRIRKTQGIHDRYAVDIGAPSGTPIYAAAAGKVVVARNGYNGGYGNLVIVQHPNGTETRYAHMSKLGTTSGKQVSQGEVIGYVGTTGRSTGNHLHIEVRGARNPFQ
ncbi:MAG: M23 family metallopeptidase, partial [Candidatus Nomurabacteria bacterium]|nr:M23 family metallopeptidase [Candidatus Nomurabacteria bacterium]